MSKRASLIEMGVDPRLASREWFKPVMYEGKNCRDRQPWGGFTDPDRCDCVGQCKADLKGES